MRIAILEDDSAFAARIIEWLQHDGHSTAWFNTGRDFLRSMPDDRYDLLIFDWMLTDMNGLEIMSHLRLKGIRSPIIFLTGRDAEEDVVKAIHAGADDYIVKPPSKSILLARIHAVTRRNNGNTDAIQDFGNIRIDFNQRRFEVAGAAVSLTEKETELALYFFGHIGVLMSRVHLIQVVWGSGAEIDTRTVDVHISHLRSKLNLTPERGWRLISVYHQGYRLERVE